MKKSVYKVVTDTGSLIWNHDWYGMKDLEIQVPYFKDINGYEDKNIYWTYIWINTYTHARMRVHAHTTC